NQNNAGMSFQYSFALIDAEGQLVDWDKGFELEQEWFGLRPALTPGANYRDILREALQAPVVRSYIAESLGYDDVDSFAAGRLNGFGTNRAYEYRMHEQIISVEERLTVSGGIQRVARDITLERQAQEALETVQIQLQNVTDTATDGVFTEIRRSPDGKYSVPPITEEMRQLFSLPPEDVGQDGWSILKRMNQSEDEIDRMRAAVEEAAQTLNVYSYEFFVRDGGGRIRWMRQSLTPRREPDGTIIFSGVMRDITRAKDAEDEVETLRSVVVRSFDSVLILESDGDSRNTKVLYVNPKFEQLFGQSAAELVGSPIEKLEFLVSDVEHARVVYEAIVSGEEKSAELEVTHSDGHSFWVEMRADVIQQFDDGRYRWAVIGHDITDRRRAIDDLVQAMEAAQAGNRAKSEFLANMSHELRTPLNAVIGFSELIENNIARGGWKDAYIEYIQDIVASGRHLLELIDSVLDLSKIEAGMLELDLASVDLDHLVHLSATLMAQFARSAHVSVSVEGRIGADVMGDALKLKQVVLNVLSNAIKFTPNGGSVRIALETDSQNVMVTITDTGCGIPESDLDRVTLPFVQIDSSLARRHPGTGLGLAIAKRICELHHGTLKINSVVDLGTTVCVALPRRQPLNCHKLGP
ncbi:MAG: sensor signal transduction histidine kinase, partial [Rhodospirillales bacterium]|nr:sensor signal transduction histidine kinase [Rhodospirillales bacterium]